MFLQRPRGHRNEVWEADHVEAPVEVAVAGRLIKPWVTWFVDTATDVVCGTAVTPGRQAGRASWLRCAPPSPSRTVRAAGWAARARCALTGGRTSCPRQWPAVLGGSAVVVEDLPGYTPHLKGTVETLNGAAKRTFFVGVPRTAALRGRLIGDGSIPTPGAAVRGVRR